MNTKNLILTPVGGMNREEWLQWRKPLFHVENFLNNWVKTQSDSNCTNWRDPSSVSSDSYVESKNEFLKYVFETEAWKEFVFPCIGGSEIASVVGLNPYQSVIELFYEKVGLKQPWDEENSYMFWGKRHEELISQMWQYWGGSEESMIANFNEEKIIRRCRRLNFYAQNKAFPYLFVSVDRLINRHEIEVEGKLVKRDEGALELKQTKGFAAQKWENGIPPMYVAQNQQQILVLELGYGELAILTDGSSLEVFPFDAHEAICDRLKREGEAFYKNVKKAIEFWLLYSVTGDKNYLAEIDRLSPEPDGSLSYQNFLKEQYKEKGGEILGGDVEIHLAEAYSFCNAKMKEFEVIQMEASNKLKAFMKESSVIDLGRRGKVTWKATSKGNRTFRVAVKHDDDFKFNQDILKTVGEVQIFSEEKK